jgi:hypothetical protein
MATSITISGLTLAPSIQTDGNLIIDQNAGTYRTRVSDLLTYISSQTLSTIVATSGTFTSINTGTLSASSDVTITGNLIVNGNISDPIGSFGNIAGTITTANQPYITTLGNVTVGNLTTTSNITVTANLFSKGITTVGGAIVPTSNAAAINIGSTSIWFNNIYGTAVHAQYADLAERFHADQALIPGTVVELGGSAEITSVGADLSENVFGVISTRAAYLMNSQAGPDQTHPPVAVQGRVPVRVVGKVRKGDRLVSAGAGLARAGSPGEINTWNVIGRSLADKTSLGEGLVEAVVKLNS